jgi:hypothetical protein
MNSSYTIQLNQSLCFNGKLYTIKDIIDNDTYELDSVNDVLIDRDIIEFMMECNQ